MDKDFSDFIQTVLDKTDIVRLISRYVVMEKKGNTYWACCPFHHESQPSFAVNEAKQFFHCFGCKESGNAISFVMKIENVEFIDALKLLAEQAGLEMPERHGGARSGVDKKRRETLYALMRDAARHYHENLASPAAKTFRDYLEERQIPPSMVTRFGLGASVDFTEMISYLQKKGYGYELIHDAGIAETKDGRSYDVFGKRLIFPIIDNMGHVVAFGGRTLEKDVHFAKYRNSTQTDIFDKSKVIYAVNLLKKRKAQAPVKYVVMTEGYMDVIALHKAGFDTAVASMGTALTVRQARQLKLYSDLVYISYDGDTAGQKATMRGLEILRDSGLTVKVVRLPDGLDPDDVIKRGGPQAYQKLLDEAIPLTAYKIETLAAHYDMNDPDQKAKFAIEAARVVRELDNPVEQEQYFNYISQKTGFSNDVLVRQSKVNGANERTERRDVEPERNSRAVPALDGSLKFFLSSILNEADYVDFDIDVGAALPDELSKKLYSACRDVGAKAALTEVFSSGTEEERRFVDELLNYRSIQGDGRQKFVDIRNRLRCLLLESELDRLKKLHKDTKDQNVLVEMQAVSRELANARKNRS